MKPFFSYQGGKSKEVPIIEKYLPLKGSYDTFVDVFGGGGSVILSQMGNKDLTFHYNDKNTTTYNIFDASTNPTKANLYNKKLEKIIMTPENNQLVVKNNLNVEPEIAFLYKSKVAYLGITNIVCTSKTFKVQPLSNLYDFSGYASQFTDINLLKTNKDYKEIFNQYKNDRRAFLYLDPPYVSKKMDEYNIIFKAGDIIYIHDFMQKCKCRVMINIDYVGYTRELFNEFHKFSYPIKYASSVKYNINSDVYGKYHLIACNY